MIRETVLSILKIGLKFFLVLLPWQTLYIVHQGVIPLESVVIHVNALFLLLLIGLAVYGYKPTIPLNIVGFAGLVLVLYVNVATNTLLALQQVLWLLLGGGLYWLLCKKILTQSEQTFYLVIGAILPAILGLWQFFAQTSITSSWLGVSFISPELTGAHTVVSESGRWLRAFGSFPHPNIFGGYLVAIIMAVCTQSNESTIFIKKNWVGRLLVVIFTAALVLTFSRSAVCVWILALLFYHYQIIKTKPGSELAIRVFISMLVALIVFLLTWSIWSGRVGQGVVSRNEVVSVSERIQGAQMATVIIKNNWIYGVGPGNYTQALHKAFPGLKTWELAPVHLVPLLIVAEWGLIGLLFLGVLGYYLGVQALFLLPILLLDHYLYSQWSGILVGVILILSTGYPHRCSTEPKK